MKSFILISAFIVAASATVSAKTSTTKVLANGYPYSQVPFTNVNLAHNSFWGARLQAAREVTVPLAFSKCESEHRYKNFDMAAYTLGTITLTYNPETAEASWSKLKMNEGIMKTQWNDNVYRIILKTRLKSGVVEYQFEEI